jgi:hypothetical protein
LGVQPGLLASDDQSVHHERMSEDEIGEIRDELKAYKQKLDELREDFKFFLMHEFEATNRIIEKANQRGNPRCNQPVVERCRKYLDKYAIGGAY